MQLLIFNQSQPQLNKDLYKIIKYWLILFQIVQDITSKINNFYIWSEKYNILTNSLKNKIKMRPRTPQKKASLQLQRERKPQIINNSYVFSSSINGNNNSSMISANNSAILQNHSSIVHSNTQQSTAYQHHQMQIQIPMNFNQSIHTKNSQIALNNKNNQIHYSNPNKSGTNSHSNNSNTNKMSLVKKYIQQEMIQARNNKYSQPKEKEYREVVISEQFIRSHKLYKMLKEQISVADARFVRETSSLNQTLESQTKKVKQIKDDNHKIKVQLWELKTQLMELKGLIEDQQQENKKLAQQYEYANNEQEGEYQEGSQDDQQQQQFQGQQGQYQEQKEGNQKQLDQNQNQQKLEQKMIDKIQEGGQQHLKVGKQRNIDVLKHNLQQIKQQDRNQELGKYKEQQIKQIKGIRELELNQSIDLEPQKQDQI